MYKKSQWYFFDQGSIDGKSEVKVVKRDLVAELKLKMLNLQKWHFLFQLHHQVALLIFNSNFHIYGPLPQKSYIQIFHTLSINTLHSNIALCISGILKVSFWKKSYGGPTDVSGLKRPHNLLREHHYLRIGGDKKFQCKQIKGGRAKFQCKRIARGEKFQLMQIIFWWVLINPWCWYNVINSNIGTDI